MPGHAQDMVGYAGDMAGTHRGSRLETAKYSTTQTKRFFFFFFVVLIMDWTQKEDIVQACKDVNTKTFLFCLEKTNRWC